MSAQSPQDCLEGNPSAETSASSEWNEVIATVVVSLNVAHKDANGQTVLW